MEARRALGSSQRPEDHPRLQGAEVWLGTSLGLLRCCVQPEVS